MSKVTSLFGGPTATAQPDARCVAELERLLEMARSGEIVGIALAAVHSDLATSAAIAGSVDTHGVIGALEIVKHELLEAARR